MVDNITDSTPVQIEWDVRQLLTEWKLEIILPHLIAEKIDAEILEMIKIHHIRMLLCNFPLGVQIRFEHNLEQWRYKIGKPLHVHKCCHHGSDFMCKQSYEKDPLRASVNNSTIIPTQTKPPPSQQQIRVVQFDRPAPKQMPDTNDELLIPINNTTPPETPLTNRSIASSARSPAKSIVSQDQSSIDDILQSIPYPPKPYYHKPKENLREILLDSKPDGAQLLKIYSVRKTFTKPERRRLLNVIVTYYLRHGLRLDLQTSYAHEEAILRMFPNERLEMYRKSKRGSLYSKYMNAKKSIFYSQRKRRGTVDTKITEDNEDNVESSDMDTIAFTEDTASMSGVTNRTMENELNNTNEMEELSYCLDEGDSKISLIKPKLEMDSDLPIQTAYRLHREVVILTRPFSYAEFLEKACSAYSISNADDYYLAVNDCEISEKEFKCVIMQYYKLATFIVEVKQKSSFLNSICDDLAPVEETTFKIAPNHLPTANEIRNLPSLLHVVAHSDLGKPLENRHQSAIAKAVIDECLNFEPNRALKRQDFLILAQNVCQAFPLEEESTYFIPSQPNCQARGKIWGAYNAKRTFLLQSGVAKKRSAKRRQSMDVDDFKRHQDLSDQSSPDEEDVGVDFSENTNMDWDYLMLKWSETYDQRCKLLKEEKLMPLEYMDRYSILKSDRGITLMEMDVHNKHPTSLTMENWLTLYGKVIAKAQAKKRKCEYLPKILNAIVESNDEKYSAGLALLLIPYILPHNGRKNELNGERASKADIQHRFIKEYKSLDDLRADPKPADLQIRFVHSHHRVTYAEFGISGVIFQCSDLMEALSCLFHYIVALNIGYPKSCDHVWQFVQFAIFHIDLGESKLPSVEGTISDLQLA